MDYTVVPKVGETGFIGTGTGGGENEMLFRKRIKIVDLPAVKGKTEDGELLVKPITYRRYCSVLRAFTRWLNPAHPQIRFVGTLKDSHILQFVNHLESSGLAVATINGYKRDLKSMLRSAGREDLGEMLKQKKEPRRSRAMSDDNFAKIVALASVRDVAMLLFFRHTGVRRQSIPLIRIDHLSMWQNDEGEWMLACRAIQEKGGVPRGVYAKSDDLVLSIKLWLSVRGAHHNPDFVFTSTESGEPIAVDTIGSVFRKLRLKAKLPKSANIFPHALRHRKAQELLLEHDPALVAAYLGHESPNTTLNIYAVRTEDIIARQTLGESLPPDFWG